MDAALLAAAAPGPVVVVALAGAPGREYDTATANAVRHYTALGAVVHGAPDARTDRDGALAALAGAGLVVLPGGSPARLLGALATTGMGAAIARQVEEGVTVMGSSAGAMALCEHCVMPARSPSVVHGLGLVPRCMVVPHYSGHNAWTSLAPEGAVVLGLPECSGLFIQHGTATAVGLAPSTVGDRIVPVGDSVVLR